MNPNNTNGEVITEQGYRGIDGDVPTVSNHMVAAEQTFIAAGIYVVFIVLCVLRLLHIRFWVKPSQSMDNYAD